MESKVRSAVIVLQGESSILINTVELWTQRQSGRALDH